MTHHGKHYILTSVHAPEQVLRVMGFAHHEDSADWCATDVKEVVDTNTMELVRSHHESRCIHYQHSYMIVERRTMGRACRGGYLDQVFKPHCTSSSPGVGDFISRGQSPQLISIGSGVFWITGLFSLWLPLYDQTMADRLTCLEKFICRLNGMHWKSIGSSSAGGYGLCIQWGKCWFEFHSCKGCCPPQSSKTCSFPSGEQMYLLSVFFKWTSWKKNNHLVLT